MTKPSAPHPKVIGATGGSLLGLVVTVALDVLNVVKLTPGEATALSTATAALGGYLTPSRSVPNPHEGEKHPEMWLA